MARPPPHPWTVEDFLAFEAEEPERSGVDARPSLEAICEGSGR